MSIATQFKVSDVTLTGAQNIKITNLDAPSANNEVSLLLSTGLKEITIRSRLKATMKLAFVSGESGTKYITVPKNANYSQGRLSLSSTTLYVQTNISSNTIEVIEYY